MSVAIVIILVQHWLHFLSAKIIIDLQVGQGGLIFFPHSNSTNSSPVLMLEVRKFLLHVLLYISGGYMENAADLAYTKRTSSKRALEKQVGAGCAGNHYTYKELGEEAD